MGLHPNYPAHISDINEKAFWSALRPGGNRELAAAVRAGRAGRKTEAYAGLVAHHRQSMAKAWAHKRSEILSGPAPEKAQVADLLVNRIAGWHHKKVDFGRQIDWNTQAWGSSGLCGFHYMGWLVPAIGAYARTGDPQLRRYLVHVIEDYYAHRNRITWTNAVGHHPTYYELGAGAKTAIFSSLYLLLINTGDLPVAAAEAFNKLFLGFGRALHAAQKSGYRSGNWQITGCTRLLQLTYQFPEYAEAPAWRRTAMRMLHGHLDRDFFADGGHKERCWGYGMGVAGNFADVYDLIRDFGGSKRDAAVVLGGVRKAYRWFAQTIGPQHHLPAYGDNQLGAAPRMLEQASRYFPRSAGASLGVDRSKSCCLKPSGYAVMRNGAAGKSACLNFNFGPFWGWHSHLDTLNLNLWSHGKPLIEELGRYDGYDNPLTLLFRAPESHNLVTVEGQPWDMVDNDNRAGRDVVWRSTPQADFLTARHTAYRSNRLLPQSVDAALRRTIVFVKDPGYALVLDTCHVPSQANAIYSIAAHWHSPFPFRRVDATTYRTAGKVGCLVAQARPQFIRHVETGVDYSKADYTSTGDYPERHYLRLRRWMPLGHVGAVGFATLLYPFEGRPPQVSVKAIDTKGTDVFRAEVFEVTTPQGKDVIVLNPERRKDLIHRGKRVRQRAAIELAGGRGRMVVP